MFLPNPKKLRLRLRCTPNFDTRSVKAKAEGYFEEDLHAWSACFETSIGSVRTGGRDKRVKPFRKPLRDA